jgi:hypothetical protein
MSTINWVRLLLGGLVIAVICFLTDGFIHERLVMNDWLAVYQGLHVATPREEHGGAGIFFFMLFEVGRGFLAIILYVLMRPICKPGPRTAICAAVVMWLAFSFTGPAQFIPLGFYSHALWFKVGALQLVTSIIATLAGAALYKERA